MTGVRFPRWWRWGVVSLAAVLVLAGCSRASSPPVSTAVLGSGRSDFPLSVYRGLGTWVDVFDYVPAFQANGAPPNFAPESVDDVAGVGVRTLFLQAAIDDDRGQRPVADAERVAAIMRRAHALGVAVVAWYLPKFGDVARDLAIIRGILDYRVDGRGFDGLALDIEWTEDVPDPVARNAALVDLSREVRNAVGVDRTLGAIVFPPVQTEVLNRTLWPDFPYRTLGSLYDVWMPMAYWTFRTGDYRDAYRYTAESIQRLRTNLDDPSTRVAPIGGIGDLATVADYQAFLKAVRDTRSIGWSVYDFDTTRSSHWWALRAGPG
ncbi:MAG: hypothetical protein ACOYNI_05395 [Acidimicrobiia bacterium]